MMLMLDGYPLGSRKEECTHYNFTQYSDDIMTKEYTEADKDIFIPT